MPLFYFLLLYLLWQNYLMAIQLCVENICSENAVAEMLIVKKLKVKIPKTPSQVWFELNKRHLILSVHCIFSTTYIELVICWAGFGEYQDQVCNWIN